MKSIDGDTKSASARKQVRPAARARKKAAALKESDAGHAAHTQAADARGLPGEMPRPIKVTFIGAGSFFTSNLAADLLQIPGSRGGEIALVDIDESRLKQMARLVKRLVAFHGNANWKVTATTDRHTVLKRSDYVVSCIEVSGVDCVRHDNDIPAKYGVDQSIGDTIGPGGLFKGLRTIPVWLEILKDVERYCPQAMVMNYTNPMGMLCLAAFRTTSLPVIGLCHSVQGTSQLLAKWAGVPYEEMEWTCAGINHLAWFTTLRHNGRDLYPRLMKQWSADVSGRFRGKDKERDFDIVRKDMALHFGAFITESSGHLSEYLPYYRKRKDLLQHYMREAYGGESGYYANNWPLWRQRANEHRDAMLKNGKSLENPRTWEYATWIIEAREKNQPYRLHGNVYNKAGDDSTLISNLPADGCVEVATFVDRNGFQPTRYGPLPSQMAALCASNMAFIDLGAQAAIEKSVEKAVYALMLDPLTAAVCSPAEIKKMTLEMFAAEKAFLKGYK